MDAPTPDTLDLLLINIPDREIALLEQVFLGHAVSHTAVLQGFRIGLLECRFRHRGVFCFFFRRRFGRRHSFVGVYFRNFIDLLLGKTGLVESKLMVGLFHPSIERRIADFKSAAGLPD